MHINYNFNLFKNCVDFLENDLRNCINIKKNKNEIISKVNNIESYGRKIGLDFAFLWH